jgi:cytoskeletal protein CcmA (bactofilin family)
MASYTRQSTFADGDTITSALFNNEYNQLLSAFVYASSGTTGHRHDGTAAEGGNIHTIGDQDFLNKIVADSTNNRWGVYVQVSSSAVEQIRIQDGAIVPVTDNDIDLGTTSLEFKDGFFDGTIHVDTLDVDANATIAGTLDITGNTTVGGTLVVTGTTTLNGGTLTLGDAASDNVVFGADVNSNIIPNTDSAYDLGSASQEWRDLYLDGTAHIDTLDVDVNATVSGTLGVTGVLTATSLDISGDIDVDGTTNLDVVDIDGAVDIATTLAVGGNVDFNGDLDVDGTTNLDVVDIDGAVDMASTLAVAGVLTGASLDISGNIDIDGITNLDAVDIDGAVQIDAAFTSGVDGQGYDTKFFGDTASAFMIWDTSADDLIFSGAAGLIVPDGQFTLGSTAVTSTAAELNLLDTASANSVVNSKAVIYGSSGEVAGTLSTAAQANITSLGTLTALTVDNLGVNGNTITANSGALNLTPASGSAIVLDGTINVDAGVVTGATSITSTAFVGDITGDITGNADTATTLATARTIGGTSFNGSANIAVGLADTATALATARTIGGTSFDGTANIAVALATLATTATVSDSTANTNFPVVFNNESNALLDDTGALRYNPSTGTLLVPNLVVAGTTSTVDTVTMEASNAIIFEGATADDHETTLTIIDPTADRTINLPNQSGTVPVLAAASNTAVTSTPEELNILDGATVVVGEINALDIGSTAVGTAVASKAVILDSNKDYTGIRNLTISGELDAATLDVSGDVDVDGTTNLDAVDIDGAVNMATTLLVTGETTLASHLNMGDGDVIKLGDSADLQIHHDGNNALLTNTTGNLYIQDSNGTVHIQGKSGEESITAAADGAVTLYHNNAVKLATASGGITVTGEVAATTLDVSGAIDIAGNSVLASVDVTGLATAATFEPDGDTAAGDNAAIGYTAAEGLILTGQGSTSDVTIKNDADVTVLSVATGTGNVGIGTTAPANLLQISNASGQNDTYGNVQINYTGTGDTNSGLTVKNYSGTSQFMQWQTNGVRIGSRIITNSGVGDVIFTAGADSEKMRILANGNVGIGTTAPANKLDVVGDSGRSVARGGSTAGQSWVEAQASNYWSAPTYTGTSLNQYGSTATGTTVGLSNASLGSLLFQNGSACLIHNNTSAPIVFATASTERMRILGGGAMVVAGTSAYSDGTYGEAKLQFNTVSGGHIGACSVANTNNSITHLLFKNVQGAVGSIGTHDDDLLIFTNNAERVRITNAGNMDVAGVATAATFEPDGDTAAGDNAAIGYTAAEGLILTGQGSTSDITIKNDADATVFYVPTGTNDAFFTGGVYLSPTNGSTSTCSLELGANRTGNGYAYIDLAGDTTYSDFGLRLLRGNSGANAASLISHRGTGALELLCVEAAPMTFSTSSSECIRIASAGTVSVGTTSAVANARLAVERIPGAGNQAAIGFTSSGTAKWKIGNIATDSFVVYTPSDQGVYIAAGANSWTGTSDERLKNITGNIENALDAVQTLRAVKFTWIADDENKSQVGLIAQDVQAVLPEVISEDAEGYLGIRYTETIPLLVAAIQEQQTTIEALEARITALEG